MHSRLTIALLAMALIQVFALAPAAVAQDTPEDKCIQPLLSEQLKLRVRARQQQPWEAAFPPSLFKASDGRVFTASQNKTGQLEIFEPLLNSTPLLSIHLSGDVTRVRWMESQGTIHAIVGDRRGNVTVVNVLESTQAGQFQGSYVDVLPEVYSDLAGDGQLVVGLGQLQRVRIMPVGRFSPQRDLQVSGPVRETLLQVIKGEPLLAVASKDKVEVFNLNDDGAEAIATLALNLESDYSLALVKDENESPAVALAQATGGVMLYMIESQRAVATFGKSTSSELITLRRQDGATVILSGSEYHIYSRGMFYAGHETEPGALALIEGPEARVYGFHVSQSNFTLRELGTKEQSPLWILDKDEKVLAVTALSYSTTRHLVAVQTDKRLVTLELNLPKPSGN
jgi:hypothetical protein